MDSHSNAADAGEILIRNMMKRGGAGVVTDGAFRDIPACHMPPSSPTNPINNHAVNLNVPIGCGEIAVFPGGIVTGDDEGVEIPPIWQSRSRRKPLG